MSLWTCLAAAGGCVDTYEVTGRQVRIEADAELQMCAGTVEHMDRFIERFAAEIGLPLAGEPWIDYRWLTPAHLWRQNPCGGSRACAMVRTVYATKMPHEHELIHAAASDLGLAHPFLIEGLAVAFEGTTREEEAGYDAVDDEDDEADTAAPEAGVLEVLRGRYIWLPGQHYRLAGGFTRYLIDRFGLRRYFEFYRRTWYADPYSALARAFQQAFGVSLEQVVVDFEGARTGCGHEGYRFKLLECEAPALAWDGLRLARNFRVDCDDAEVVGQAGEAIQLLRSLEVAEDGRYRVGVRTSGPAKLAIGSCGGCERQFFAELTGNREVELPAGRYFVRVESLAREPITVGLTVERIALGLDSAPEGPP